MIASGSAVAGNEEVDGCQERRVLFETEVVDNVDHADGSEMRKRAIGMLSNERTSTAPHLGLSMTSSAGSNRQTKRTSL